MKRAWLLVGLAFLMIGAPLVSAEAADTVHVIQLDNQIINPVTQEYILDAIARAEQAQAACLVMELDTPGGLLDSTRTIVKAIMNARVPVVVYVGPAGARAGSAGVFITLAAHVAAMAPSTNIGAAHPVMGEGGGGVRKLIRKVRRTLDENGAKPKKGKDTEEEIVEETEQDPMMEKVMNDTIAWVTTIANTRHRNVEWAKKAVTESVSAGEDEALAEHIIDLIAADRDDLLRQIDGLQVETVHGPVTLRTAGAAATTVPMTTRQSILAALSHPNIAYLLMMFGFFGLLFEFTHPGIGFPGVAGAICLVLALFAFQTLPINYAGVLLILLGIVLLIAEVKIVSYGLLTVAAVVALTLGSLMLIETPHDFLRVSWTVIAPVVGATAGLFLFLVGAVVRSHARPAAGGAQGLIGEVGVAQSDFGPHQSGTVFVHGELWQAASQTAIRQGSNVRVVRVQGLRVDVEPA